MLSYLSKTSGIGGTIKSKPDDFIVEEISGDGSVLEIDKNIVRADEAGKFTHFILQKNNWSTSSAIHEIGKRLGVGKKSMSFAGTKDKIAISTQLASVFNISKEKLLSVRIKDIQINGAWYANDKVRLGQLLGNRFTITIRDATKNSIKIIPKIVNKLDGSFPNYFGEQRFGSTRKNTHLIGEKILRGELKDAVNLFLCDIGAESNELTNEARKELRDSGDYCRALKTYPKYLKLERTMLSYLASHPDNHANALRSLPRPTLLLFVHAFQSHLFNELLSKRVKDGNLELEQGEYYCGETFGFPDILKSKAEGWAVGKIIGYNTPLNRCEKQLLDEVGIKKEDFKIKSIPEIALKGTYRTLLAPLKDFSFDTLSDVDNSKCSALFKFELPAGSYATVVMREFIDSK